MEFLSFVMNYFGSEGKRKGIRTVKANAVNWSAK